MLTTIGPFTTQNNACQITVAVIFENSKKTKEIPNNWRYKTKQVNFWKLQTNVSDVICQ